MDRSKKIILIVVGIIVAIGFGVKACTNHMSDIVDMFASPNMSYEHADNYTPASAGAITPLVKEIQIAWINGGVRVEYAPIDSITWQETYVKGQQEECNTLHYWMDGHTLYINYFEANGKVTDEDEGWKFSLKRSNKHACSMRNLRKDLVVTIPQNWMLDELEVHNVNGDLETSVDAREIDIESVNGSKTVRVTRAEEIKVSGINGAGTIYLPERTAFKAELEKVNGSFKTDFATQQEGNTYYYGNKPYVDIELEAVNGNLQILKL